ncbi:MAG TPA: ketopantoate reductase family protein [Solirubrobacteraceae bacterium]|nr:ketopantoate reductase family protein [Solirubrobacteraceae bacterium]
MTRIAVLGPGGVGGFLAAALSHADEDVTVVGREPTVERIGADGIHLTSVLLGEFTARPATTAKLGAAVDVLFVATKATGLDAALPRIRSEPALVVPLLNGLDHMQLLRERFATVAAGTIRIEADRREPGLIVQTSPAVRVELASDDPGMRPALERLAGMLDAAGVPALVGRGEAQILWSKLVRLTALACTTSASDQPIGFIRADPEWRRTLEACVQEAAAVANADGAELDPGGPLGELEAAHAELGSSMRRDIAAGREPELDAIAGSVLRAGRRHGIDCPTIERLSGEIAARAGIPKPTV